MLNKLLLLFLIFFAITPNLGFFTPQAAVLIAVIIFIGFALLMFPGEKAAIRKNNFAGLIPFWSIALVFYATNYYGGLYQEKASVLYGFYAMLIMSLYSFFKYFIRREIPSLFIIFTAFIALSLWTIFSSPTPRVDTMIVLTEAPLMFKDGKNPYAQTFTKMYPQIEPNYYNYLPFSFIYMLPFVAVFQDPRFGILAANLLTAILLYLIFKKKDTSGMLNFFILAYLFFPRSFYMLEHVYLDVVLFSFFVLFQFFYMSKKPIPALFSLALFFSFKQPPALAFPLLIKAPHFRKLLLKPKNLLIFLMPFLLPIYYFILDRGSFLEDVLVGLAPDKITSPIAVSLTFPTFVNVIFRPNPAFPTLLIGYLLFGLSYIIIFRSKSSPTFKISLTLLCFNFFTYHAFFNSYYLVALFLLFDCMKDFFGVREIDTDPGI